MRTLRIVTASTLLAGAALVVPVVSVGASPHAVKPSFDRVPMPREAVAALTARGPPAATRSGRPRDRGRPRGAARGVRQPRAS